MLIAELLLKLINSLLMHAIVFQVVKDAIASGVDGYDADVKKAVRKAAHGLRLTREAAMSIAGKAVSMHFDYPGCIVNTEHNLKLNTFPFAQKLFLVAGSKDFLKLCKASTDG
jgi:hypothetical protein